LGQEAARYSSAELRELAYRVADAYECLADELEALTTRRGRRLWGLCGDSEAAASV
jgi:hypothetical protein